MHHFEAVVRVQVQQHFRIRVRSKSDSARFERSAQRGIVVDLAIEYNNQAAIIADHGLGRAVGQIENRKPAMRKTATTIRAPPRSRTIRPPGPHRFPSSQELGLFRAASGRIMGEYAVQSAHESLPPGRSLF